MSKRWQSWRKGCGKSNSQDRLSGVPIPIIKDVRTYVAAGYGVGCKAVKLGSGSVEEVYSNKNMVNLHGGVILIDGLLYGHSDGRPGAWTCQMNQGIKRFGGRAAWLCLFFVLTQCGPPRRSEWKLLTGEFASSWKAASIAEEGRVSIKDGEITLQPGQPMTGVRFAAWQTTELPLMRYAIEYEAMRVEGNDFFGTVTFPVNDSHVSLIIGGWGGTLVGISSIDDMDASENNTRGNAYFKNNEWHKVRVEVRDGDLRAWINDKLFVNVSTKGHKLGLRPGDIEKCIPFGFASFATQARIRDVIIRKL